MLTSSTSHALYRANIRRRAMCWMFLGSSNDRYNHIQCYVFETDPDIEQSLTCSSATRKESFLIFTAYNIASQTLNHGTCQLSLGSIIPMDPYFSVSQPATVNVTKFQSIAQASFYDYLGFSECSGSGITVSVNNLSAVPVVSVIPTPTSTSPSLLTTVPPSPRNNSTQSVSTLSSGSHDKRVEIGNAVAFPVAFLRLLLFGYVMYKRRKIQKTTAEEDVTLQQQESSYEVKPYLQQKSELEAEENRKHELEARERRYKIGIEGERHKLSAEVQNSMIRTRQELRGEEHSKELD